VEGSCRIHASLMRCLRGASFTPLTLFLSPQLRFVAGEGTLVVRAILLIGDFLFDPMKARQALTVVKDRRVGSLSQSWEGDRVRVTNGPDQTYRAHSSPYAPTINM